MPADEEEGDRAVELQPMLDAPVQPPLLLVSRGRTGSKPPLLPKDALSTMLHNLVLICTWCVNRCLGTVSWHIPHHVCLSCLTWRTVSGSKCACSSGLHGTSSLCGPRLALGCFLAQVLLQHMPQPLEPAARWARPRRARPGAVPR